ncbi:hypothetical protein PT2222_40291 [Paraburkholderia tropica]
MSDLKKGDVVRLKSGGPIMTISDVGDFSMAAGIEDGALCVWFEKNDPKEKVFDLAVLKTVEESSAGSLASRLA